MKDLIPTINEIIKYGLTANMIVADRDKLLEKNLIKFYYLSFDIAYEFDNTEYPGFNKSHLPDIRKNIESNFMDFGFYKTVIDYEDIDNLKDCAIGDAIDDLKDIVLDLLEIKWRYESNSESDGLWYFNLIFYGHTQQHILDLLNYMKQKNG